MSKNRLSLKGEAASYACSLNFHVEMFIARDDASCKRSLKNQLPRLLAAKVG